MIMFMLRCFGAELIKIKRTPFLWIHLGVPAGFLLLFWFVSSRYGWADTQFCMILFEILGMAYPLLIALLCGFVTDSEKVAGNCQAVLGVMPCRTACFIGKLFMLFCCSLASFSIIILGACLISGIAISILLQSGAAMFLGVTFLYCLHLIIGFNWGNGAEGIVGIFGVILSALCATSLGDRIWIFIPWAWPLRLGLETSIGLTVDVILTGLGEKMIIVSLATVVLLIFSCMWYNGWESKEVK